MKVRRVRSAPALVGRMAAALAAATLVALLFSAPAPAHAITRDEVIARATHWVDLRLGYSRSAYFGGYRRDCSGMVSMAWRLRKSLTSRTIASAARRIPVSSLQPGDAVRTPGHVEIFERWVSRRAGTFVTLEQSGRGVGAVRRVKHIKRGSVALRFRGISDSPLVAALAPVPTDTPTVTVAAVSLP